MEEERKNARVLDLRDKRSASKGVVTKLINAITDLMQDYSNQEEVRQKMEKYTEAISKFDDCHEEYRQLLDDPEEISGAEEYIAEQSETHEAFRIIANQWLSDAPSTPESIQEQVEKSKELYLYDDSSEEDIERQLQEEEERLEKARRKLENRRRLQEIKQQRMAEEAKLQSQDLELERERLMSELELQDARRREEEEIQKLRDLVQSRQEGHDDDEKLRQSIRHSAPVGTSLPLSSAQQTSTPKVGSGHPLQPQPSRLSWDPSDQSSVNRCVLELTQSLCQAVNENQAQTRALVHSSQTPTVQLDTFDGNPLNYCRFINSFDIMVGDDEIPVGRKLRLLLQYCKGEARAALEGCEVITDLKAAYSKAREILKRRFGDEYTVAQAFIKKIQDYPKVLEGDLRNYADTVSGAKETLEQLGYLHEIETQQNLCMIIGKLPERFRNRWLTRNRSIRESGRHPKLRDIVSFVQDITDEITDSVYGDLRAKQHSLPARKQKGGSRSMGSFAVDAKPLQKQSTKQQSTKKEVKCIKCGQSHFVTRCPQYKDMTIKDRTSFVIGKKLCLNCYNPGHKAADCQHLFRCKVPGCGQKHSTYLHPKSAPDPTTSTTPSLQPREMTTPPNSPNANWVSGGNAQVSCGFAGSNQGKVALPIVPVRVYSGRMKSYVDTYALLDSGTNQTFCSEVLVDQLGIQRRRETVSLTTIENHNSLLETFCVKLHVSAVDDTEVFQLPRVLTRPTITVGLTSFVKQGELKDWPHLADIQLPDVDSKQVHVIIGQDNNELLVPLDVRTGRPGEPHATKTKLGWTLNGPVGGKQNKEVTACYIYSDTLLSQQVDNYFKLDDLGGKIHKIPVSINDQRAIAVWEKDTRIIDGHYSTSIPFRQRPPQLPNNKYMAEHRLSLLKKRLMKDDYLKERYNKEMLDLLKKGHSEQVPEAAMGRNDGYVWYLPHHPVIHPRKPGKVRIVFDCAAKCRGISLNDTVLQGPDLTNRLVGVLLRFRLEPVGLMGDIEAMFHQVKVCPDDRDSLRYLWWEDGDPNKRVREHRMTAHLFGGVWSPSCANYALQRCATDHKEFFDRETVSTILHNFYVDDCLKSVPSDRDAIHLINQLEKLLELGGFRLTKWISNSRAVLQQIPNADQNKSVASIDLDESSLPAERALGVLWNTESDAFSFNSICLERPDTKRGMLSLMSSIFDPLGFLTPFTLRAKMLFQDVCRNGCLWDESIPEDISNSWKSWINDLPKISDLQVPRCIKPPTFQPVKFQVHNFSDASERAYGMISYLRMTDTEGENRITLLAAKGKVAPLKATTIPRLELAAAVEAVKVDRLLRDELSEIPLTESIFWTDSMIVLWYINNDNKRYKTYVANRLSFIRDGSRPEQWRYINSHENPADDASRGLTASELTGSQRWLNGPHFLQHDEATWLPQPTMGSGKPDADLELKREVQVYCSDAKTQHPTDKLLGFYSSWLRLRKAVAYYKRLVLYLQSKKVPPGSPSVEELKSAELSVVLYVQSTMDFRSKGPYAKLSPFQSADGVWRVGGRLRKSDFDLEVKHPAIIPAHHHVTKLLVSHYHAITGHSGIERVLAETRQRFWITKGRATVRAVLSSCLPCKRSRATTEVQYMADLPRDRVTPGDPPFTYVGVDYFGPFLIRRARSEVKRYGCIFTCLTIRAVHIEVSTSMETDSFLNCLQRFIARRGCPKLMRSDNGTNFVGGQAELRKAVKEFNQTKIEQTLQKKDIQWVFNPPSASHMGGVWERQIRTVRKVLSGLSQEQRLDDDGLHTLMCAVEGIINGRPITKLSDDPTDPSPLTPNHLLLLKEGTTWPAGHFTKQDLYRRRWRQVQYLADLFWTRWMKEYLPTLQERPKWESQQRNLMVGDLVLIKNESTPRNRWPLGLVTAVHPGADGLVRSVALRFNGTELERPISKLCLLEMATPTQ